MTADEISAAFVQVGARQQGHFLLASGLHSDTYLQCARVFERPEVAARLCAELAARWKRAGAAVPQTVVGPALGAVLMAYEMARAFGTSPLGARAVYAERKDGVFSFRRGFSFARGERILLCEDVVTTGGSSQEVLDVLRPFEVDVVGAISLVDRGGGRSLGVKRYEALLRVEAPAWPQAECPLCKRGEPVVAPGTKQAK
ncbi:MAG: orotate phosphoribosyltransferase [Planctomycetes bacterium]|nr:orotate phosphoribosyltransferase [Planctomycetota bacterium]